MRRPRWILPRICALSIFGIACPSDEAAPPTTPAQKIDRATDKVEKSVDDAAYEAERKAAALKQQTADGVDATRSDLERAGQRAEEKLDAAAAKTADGLEKAGDKLDAASERAADGLRKRDETPPPPVK